MEDNEQISERQNGVGRVFFPVCSYFTCCIILVVQSNKIIFFSRLKLKSILYTMG